MAYLTPRQTQAPTPSLDNPPLTSGAVKTIVTCWIFTPLCILAVILRFWARRAKNQKPVFNDWAVIGALLFNCGQSALLTYASVAGGIGHHMADLVQRWPAAVPRLLKCYVAAEPLWVTTNSLLKFSILDFYVKVFSSVYSFRLTCYTLMGVVGAYWLSTIIRMFFLCTPFAALWEPTLLQTVPGAHCLDLMAVYVSVSIINLVLDFTLFLLPMPLLWNLQMNTRRKLMLMGIFGLGFFICIITVLRVRAVYELDLADVSYTVVSDGIWSTLEPCLGIINACLPLLQPLGQRFTRVLEWTSLRKSSGGDSGGYSKDRQLPPSLGPNKPRSVGIPTRNARWRPKDDFVPLTQDSWLSSPEGWTAEAMPMREVYRGGMGDRSDGDEDDKNIQVTVGWKIHHEQV